MHQVFRDPISGLTHLAGAIFAVVALCILSVQAALHGSIWHSVSFAVFGACMLIMFVSSTVYHLVHGSQQMIAWLKRLDHMAIFLMIAGSYTPVCLIPLNGPLGWGLLAFIWLLALAGVMLKLVWLDAPRWLSTLLYVLMGWSVVFIYPALERIPDETLSWLLYGGISYSVGAVVYALRWPDPWPRWFGFHEIWHLFVIGGAFCHFWAMAFSLTTVVV